MIAGTFIITVFDHLPGARLSMVGNWGQSPFDSVGDAEDEARRIGGQSASISHEHPRMREGEAQVTWPFGDLLPFGYRALYADPPWRYENYSKAGEWKNAARHYDCMSIDQIAALPVGHLAQDKCALFMWATNPLLDRAIDVMRLWGFRYTTVAFTWAKRTRNDTGWHMGLGYSTRANAEICLLGTIGDIGLPKSRGVRSLIVEPVREHSRKPDRIISDIEAMYDGPYLELFARTQRPGWDCWGLENDKFKVAA